MPLLEVNDLKKYYPAGRGEILKAVDGVSFSIEAGETLGIVGESGCGKTTLTRLINGLIPHYYEGTLTGQTIVEGIDVKNVSLYALSGVVGSVFQNPRTQFFTVDSTSELAFGCENQGLSENEIVERIKFTAEQFGIEVLMGKNIFCLSGGEKQKIACASVSVSDPPIIVLDEPSSNLDISATEDLRRMIQLWKKQGKTVVHFIAYPYSGSNRQLYRLCTETIVRSTCNAFLGCSTYHSIEIHFRRTGQHHVQPYRNSQRMQRMVTIQAIILKTGFQGEMLVQTTFHAYPGRERHMEIPFRQGSADACFQCPITGLGWRYSHRLCRFFLRRWQHSIYISILMARI